MNEGRWRGASPLWSLLLHSACTDWLCLCVCVRVVYSKPWISSMNSFVYVWVCYKCMPKYFIIRSAVCEILYISEFLRSVMPLPCFMKEEASFFKMPVSHTSSCISLFFLHHSKWLLYYVFYIFFGSRQTPLLFLFTLSCSSPIHFPIIFSIPIFVLYIYTYP